jgi:hypothetical protein
MRRMNSLWAAFGHYLASGDFAAPLEVDKDIRAIWPMLGQGMHRRDGRPHRRARARKAAIALASKRKNRRKEKGK